MYQGRHFASGSPRADRPAASRRAGGSKKPLTLFVALVLLLTLAVGGSLAWLVSDDKVQNTMVPGNVPIKIEEVIDGTTKTSITIQNTGNIDAYIRVAVVSNAVDKEGNVIAGTSSNTINANSTDWQFLGGYYYYKGTVAPGNAVELLDGEKADFTGREINILAESIQVLGVIEGKPASQVAWGVVYSDGTWTKTA